MEQLLTTRGLSYALIVEYQPLIKLYFYVNIICCFILLLSHPCNFVFAPLTKFFIHYFFCIITAKPILRIKHIHITIFVMIKFPNFCNFDYGQIKFGTKAVKIKRVGCSSMIYKKIAIFDQLIIFVFKFFFCYFMPLCDYQNILTLSHNPQTLALYILRNGLLNSFRVYCITTNNTP